MLKRLRQEKVSLLAFLASRRIPLPSLTVQTQPLAHHLAHVCMGQYSLLLW